MAKTLPFLLFFTCLFFQISGQEKQELAPCGTPDGKPEWLVKYQSDPHQYPKSLNTIYVPVTIHIVGTDAGAGFFPVSSVLDAFCTLNKDFEAAGIQFYIEGDFNYIANTTYHDHTFQQGAQMMQIYRVPNTINCYIVGSPAGNCGYSSYNLGIALAKGCTAPNDHTWAHEIGLYLSLPHPFWGWEGFTHDYAQPAPVQIGNSVVERMDSIFCDFAGDGFCDTPPDYLNFRWTCDGQQQSSILQHDPEGVPFRSDGTLFMSYANDQCMNRFSEEQIAAMRANLLTEKASYLYDQTPDEIISDPPLTIAPAQDELVDYFQAVTFEWEPVANATHYLLEISPFQNFPFVQFRYVVVGTSFVSTDFSKNKTYYWRLRPFNSRSTCPNYSEVASFKTGVLSSAQAIEGVSGIGIYPNPVNQQGKIWISLASNKALHLEGRLLSASGQVVRAFEWEVVPGAQVMSMDAEGLSSGMYLLQLNSAQGLISMKVAVGR